jgi:hypothetical protein
MNQRDWSWTTAIVALCATSCAPAPPQENPTLGNVGFDRTFLLEESSETSANVSLGDINGDGHLDVVLVKGRHWPLLDQVLVGDGKGAFLPARPLGSVPDRSYSGLLVDVDRDGDLDVVVSNDQPDPKLVHLNDGSGGFSVGSTFGRPEWPTRHISVADLNGDSLPDVVLANRTGDDSGYNYICFGVGEGRFSTSCTGFSRESATGVTPADFNGDGWVDLAVPHREGAQSHIYLNSGAGGFEQRIPFGPPDAAIRTARAADLNGDAVLDIVVIDQRRGPAIYPGRLDGSYGAARPLGDAAPTPYAIELSDLDGDERQDVIVGYVEARPVAYFIADDLTFVAVPFGDADGVAYGFSVGDVDEDGFMDIAMARSDAPNVLYFGSPAGDRAGSDVDP